MAKYQNLINSISSVIRTNGNNEITGQILQDVLKSIVNVVGANPTYGGVAHPADNPGTPDGGVVYIASDEGTYVNFGGLTLDDNELAVLVWDGESWSKESVTYIENYEDIEEAKQEALDAIAEAIQGLNIYYDIEADKGTVKDVQLKDGSGDLLMPLTLTDDVLEKYESLVATVSATQTSSQTTWPQTSVISPALKTNTTYRVVVSTSATRSTTYQIRSMVGTTAITYIATVPSGSSDYSFTFNTGANAINKFQVAVQKFACTWTFKVYEQITKTLPDLLDEINDRIDDTNDDVAAINTELHNYQSYGFRVYAAEITKSNQSGTHYPWSIFHDVYPCLYCKLEITSITAATNCTVRALLGTTVVQTIGTITPSDTSKTFYFKAEGLFNKIQYLGDGPMTSTSKLSVMSNFYRDVQEHMLYNQLSSEYKTNVRGIAHQGFSDSTGSVGYCRKSALIAAARNHFDGVEVDVVFSSDDVPFLCHDDTFVDQDSGTTITVAQKTAAELVTYSYYGETICSLDEAVSIIKLHGLDIELDHTNVINTQTRADAVIDIIKKYKAWENVIWTTASSILTYTAITAMFPKARVLKVQNSSVTDDDVSYVNGLASQGYNIILAFNHNYNSLVNVLPKLANLDARVKVMAYTIDTASVYNDYAPYVDYITSNAFNKFIADTGLINVYNIV